MIYRPLSILTAPAFGTDMIGHTVVTTCQLALITKKHALFG
jgi:hypothetical protein